MKRKLTVVLLIVALLLTVSGQIAAAGDGGMNGGMNDGTVTTKQFNVPNMPEPKAVHYFNKVIDLGNGLKGEMLIGKGEKTYMDVWKPNSGKRDLYVWNGSQWVYLHSITDIVPGFEKPMTINTYKYATWDEYTHTVPTDNNPTPNPNPPSSGLTVSLSGPAKLGVNQQGKYTATVNGGTPPYTLTWSSDGYVSSENYDAYYEWSAEGKYTVTVAVRDLNGQTATASMDVTVEDNSVVFTPTDLYVINEGDPISGYSLVEYGKKSSGLERSFIGVLEFNDPSGKKASASIQSLTINGKDYTSNLLWHSQGTSSTWYGGTTFQLDDKGHGEFELGLSDTTGLPVKSNVPFTITAKFSDGSKVITKSGFVPNVYYGSVFNATASKASYSSGTVQQQTYHYWVTDVVETLTSNGDIHLAVNVKEVETDEYHPTLESLKQDPKYQQAMNDLLNGNADVTESKDVPASRGVTASDLMPLTDVAMSESGATQHTSDRNIETQYNGNGVWKGTLCASDGKKVHPYTTYRSVSTSWVSDAGYAHSSSYDFSSIDKVGIDKYSEFEPELLSSIKYAGSTPTLVELPDVQDGNGNKVKAVIFEKGKELKYEIPPTTGNLVIVEIRVGGSDVDRWTWNKNYSAWEVAMDLTPPETIGSNVPELSLSVEYQNKSDVIKGITSSSSITVDKLDTHNVAYGDGTVEYVLSNGKYLNPSANLIKDVYSSADPSLKIATAYVSSGYIHVIGIAKGSGVLSLSKEELQGPFGTSIPIKVEKTGAAGNIDFTVNGVDVNSAGSTKWLNDFPDGKWYNIKGTSGFLFTYKHAYNYDKNVGFLYRDGLYKSTIKNKSDVPLLVTVSWSVPKDDHDISKGVDIKSKSYTISPGSSKDVARDAQIDILSHVVQTWGSNGWQTTAWTSKITYTVQADVNGEYITIATAADTVEREP